MTLNIRIAPILLLTVAAAACGGSASPTAPTSTASTSTTSSPPTTTTTIAATPTPTAPAPAPSPAPTTLTGTWGWGAPGASYMTLTQNGSSISGTLTPTSMVLNDIRITDGGTVAGTVSGSAVTLTFTDTINIAGLGVTLNCTMGSTFTGTVSGATMSGTMVAGSTPMNCGGDVSLGTIYTPPFTGPGTFYRQ